MLSISHAFHCRQFPGPRVRSRQVLRPLRPLPLLHGAAGLCLYSRWAYNHRVYASVQVPAKFHEDLPKCSSPYAAARTFFTPSSRVDLNMMTREHTVRTTRPGRLGRERTAMPSSYPTTSMGVLWIVTVATPPGSSAPESDRGLSSFLSTFVCSGAH